MNQLVVVSVVIIVAVQFLPLVFCKSDCKEGHYLDGATSICQPCKSCCPPRPKNPFCVDGCNLEDICSAKSNDLPIYTIVVIVVIVVFILVLATTAAIIFVCVMRRRRPRFLFDCFSKCVRRNHNGLPIEAVQLETQSPDQERLNSQAEIPEMSQGNNSHFSIQQHRPYFSMPTQSEEPAQNKFYSMKTPLRIQYNSNVYYRTDINGCAGVLASGSAARIPNDNQDGATFMAPSWVLEFEPKVPIPCQEDVEKMIYTKDPKETDVKRVG